MQFLADRKVPNPVVLTGDIHSNWVNDLRVDDRKAGDAGGGDRVRRHDHHQRRQRDRKIAGLDKLPAANPCVKFHNRERGYVRCTVTPETWTSDYVVVEDVTKPGGMGDTYSTSLGVLRMASFDPCSPGSCWATAGLSPVVTGRMEFRSLFSWIMLGDAYTRFGGTWRIVSFDPCSPGSCWATPCPPHSPLASSRVSILVLLDHAGRLLFSCAPIGIGSVSILVLLDHAGRLDELDIRVHLMCCVSILVLLDHAGRRELLRCLLRRHQGFDPCSPGSCWATRSDRTPLTGLTAFRSLFSWIMLGDTDGGICDLPGYQGFRSLFSWIMLGDHRPRSGGGNEHRVSILVLLDHAGRQSLTSSPTGTASAFRSLFSWIMLGDSIALVACYGKWGVSILVLLDHAGRLRRSWLVIRNVVRFRSLFSWIMLGDANRGDLPKRCGLCFDPCSPGSCWATFLSNSEVGAGDACFDPCSPGSCWAT